MPECKVSPVVPMTSERSCRMARTEEEALAELERCAGSQWDPELVNVFLKTTATANS